MESFSESMESDSVSMEIDSGSTRMVIDSVSDSEEHLIFPTDAEEDRSAVSLATWLTYLNDTTFESHLETRSLLIIVKMTGNLHMIYEGNQDQIQAHFNHLLLQMKEVSMDEAEKFGRIFTNCEKRWKCSFNSLGEKHLKVENDPIIDSVKPTVMKLLWKIGEMLPDWPHFKERTFMHDLIERKSETVVRFAECGLFNVFMGIFCSLSILTELVKVSDTDFLRSVIKHVNKISLEDLDTALEISIAKPELNEEEMILLLDFLASKNKTAGKWCELIFNAAMEKENNQVFIYLANKFPHQFVKWTSKDNKVDEEKVKVVIEKHLLTVHIMLEIGVKTEDKNMLEFALFNYKGERDSQDANGRTALHHAVTEQSVVWENVAMLEILLRWGCNQSIKDNNGNTPLHYAVRRGKFKTVKVLLRTRGVQVKSLDINTTNKNGDTALHLCSVKNHVILIDLLNAGADFTIKNDFSQSFLSKSNEAKEVIIKLFKERKLEKLVTSLATNKFEYLTSIIINERDDEVTKVILQIIADLCSKKHQLSVDWFVNEIGKTLLVKICNCRKFDKTIFKESYNVLLEKIITAKEKDKERIKEYCYEELDENMRLSVYNDLTDLLPKEVDSSFIVKESLKTGFALLIVLNMVDFVSDVALTYQYGNWTEVMKDYPLNRTACEEVINQAGNYSLVCNLHIIPSHFPFTYSLVILLLPFILQWLMMETRSAQQFRSTMAGCCCWQNTKNKKCNRWFGLFFAVVFQPVAMQCYKFWCEKSHEVQVANENKASEVTKGEPKDNGAVATMSQGAHESIADAACPHCKNINDEDLAKKAALLNWTTKLITACTENSFMPLLQFHTLFPQLVFRSAEAVVVGNCTNPNDCIVMLSHNWQFYLTVFSLVSSVISMSVTWTFIYFSRQTKDEQRKDYLNIATYFASVLLQCISRLLAFEIALSVFCPVLGGWSFPVTLALLILFHLVIFSFMHCLCNCVRKSKTLSILDAICTAVASIYVFNDIKLSTTAFRSIDSTKEQQQQLGAVEEGKRKSERVRSSSRENVNSNIEISLEDDSTSDADEPAESGAWLTKLCCTKNQNGRNSKGRYRRPPLQGNTAESIEMQENSKTDIPSTSTKLIQSKKTAPQELNNTWLRKLCCAKKQMDCKGKNRRPLLKMHENEIPSTSPAINDTAPEEFNISDAKTETKTKRRSTFLDRFGMEALYLTVNALLAATGWLITDSKYDKIMSFTIVVACQSLGTIIKCVYYLFLHPWKDLQKNLKEKKIAFGVVLALIFVGICSYVGYKAPQSRVFLVIIGVIAGLCVALGIFAAATSYTSDRNAKRKKPEEKIV